jgi:hypothetical protein
MKRRALVSLAAVAALLLSAGRAFAEEDPGLHPRFGLGLGGGSLIVPGIGAVAVFNLEAQAGVQFNKLLGLYATLAGGGAYGKLSPGTYPLHESLLVEFTFGNRLFVALGPEMGFYDVANVEEGDPPTRSGYIYGGRLRVAWCLACWDHAPTTGFRLFGYGNMLPLSLDVSLLGGVARYMGAVDASRNTTANPLSVLALLTLYVAAR